jgi:twitching motility protein PilU
MTLDSLLKIMVSKKASDLFVSAGVAPSLKINGTISPLAGNKLTPHQARQLINGLMTKQQSIEFENTRECNFAIHRSGIGRFRVNVFQHQNHAGMVVRLIETRIPTFTGLRLPALLKGIATAKQGLVIIAGATGSGKSSTLAAMVGHINRNCHRHIVSVEDPIEFVHQPERCIISQREVGIDTESVEAALKNSLRQAPDVIVIGEIRSREVMEQALAFADTGHLCIATLHASNCVQTVERIINFFSRDQRQQVLMDLSLNLRAVIAQRLVPSKRVYGLRPALEILHTSPLLAATLQKGHIHMVREVMGKSSQYGMKTFDMDLYELYRNGNISREDAIHHADSPNEVRLLIKLGKKGGLENLSAALDGVTLLDPLQDPGDNTFPRRHHS